MCFGNSCSWDTYVLICQVLDTRLSHRSAWTSHTCCIHHGALVRTKQSAYSYRDAVVIVLKPSSTKGNKKASQGCPLQAGPPCQSDWVGAVAFGKYLTSCFSKWLSNNHSFVLLSWGDTVDVYYYTAQASRILVVILTTSAAEDNNKNPVVVWTFCVFSPIQSPPATLAHWARHQLETFWHRRTFGNGPKENNTYVNTYV